MGKRSLVVVGIVIVLFVLLFGAYEHIFSPPSNLLNDFSRIEEAGVYRADGGLDSMALDIDKKPSKKGL